MLGHQTVKPFAKGPWIDRKGARARTNEVIERFDVKTPSADTAALALSGGNQQKLIVGKEMIAEPHVLIASHPTRGIDVGAQAAIWFAWIAGSLLLSVFFLHLKRERT